jgi:RHS repeat-associated protein
MTATFAFATGLASCGSASDNHAPETAAGTSRQNIVAIAPNGASVAAFAGTGVRGSAGDGGPATLAQLNDPFAATLDSDTTYVLEAGSNSVRRITPAGVIDTILQGKPELLNNGRGEQAPSPAWTTTGTWQSASPSCAFCEAFEGNSFLQVTSATGTAEQLVSVASNAAKIDVNQGIYTLSGVTREATDRARWTLEALSGVGTIIASWTATAQAASWTPFALTATLPSGTRSLRVRLTAELLNGTVSDAQFDYLSLSERNSAGPTRPSAVAYVQGLLVADFTTGKVWRWQTTPSPSWSVTATLAPGIVSMAPATLAGRFYYVRGGAVYGYAYPSTAIPVNIGLGSYVRSVASLNMSTLDVVGVTTAQSGVGVARFDTSFNLLAAEFSAGWAAGVGFQDDLVGTPGNGEKFARPASMATLWEPATNGRRNWIVADAGNNAIRRVVGDGFTTTLSGNGQVGSTGDGNLAALATFNEPAFVVSNNNAPDPTILVVDRGNNRIRKIGCITTDVCNNRRTFDPSTGLCSVAGLDAATTADDKNRCTTDICSLVAIQHIPLTAGSSCDDDNLCNGRETCDAAGACVAGAPPTVDNDNNPCTADYCDKTGGVTHAALPVGTACSTGDPCKTMGTCNGAAKQCVGAATINVDDDNVCTTDSCTAQGGIVHTPVAGTVSCSATGTCSNGVCADSGSTLGAPAYGDRTVPTSPGDMFSNLATSQGGTLDLTHAALVRGKVVDANDAALAGVTVNVQGHSEFGSTTTNATGEFFLLVNGGGALTVRFDLATYLKVERQVQPEWGGTVGLYNVRLIKPAANPTSVTIGVGSPAALLFSPLVSETVNSATVSHRTALYFPAGTTTATGVTNLQFQATEYTVGPTGAQAMPADIATNTIYTYASEFSIASGTEAVDFTKPVFAYVDNFLNLPAGTIIPGGFYDRTSHVWKVEPSGCVVKILTNNRTQVTLDTSCDTQIASLGTDYLIQATEKQKLAQAAPAEYPTGYPVGKTFWRVPLLHFSPHDFNFSGKPPQCEQISADRTSSQPGVPCQSMTSPDCICPDGDGIVKGADEPEDGSCKLQGSIIDAETQVLGERLPIGGTPFTLNYRSNAVPGYLWDRTAELNFDGPKHSALSKYRVRLSVAGQFHEKEFAKTVSGPQYMTWDGLDYAGRKVVGAQRAIVDVGAVYPLAANNATRFMDFPGGTVVQLSDGQGRAQGSEMVVWQRSYRQFHNLDAAALGLGGWTLSAFHRYDPEERVLYQGDGARRAIDDSDNVVSIAAGTGFWDGQLSPDGTLAKDAKFSGFSDIAVSPAGELYIASRDWPVVQKVGTDGKITRVAGVTSGSTPWVEGALATSTQLNTSAGSQAQGIALAPDGTLYIADGVSLLYRVDPAGKIWLVAGVPGALPTLAQCDAANGIAARGAYLCAPRTVAVGPDGAVYVNSRNAANASVIKRIEPGATDTTSPAQIATIAGGGAVDASHMTSNTLPTQIALDQDAFYLSFATGPDGSLWFNGTPDSIYGFRDIYRLYPNHQVQLFGAAGAVGDCVVGTNVYARFNAQRELAVTPDNAVVFQNSTAGCGLHISRLNGNNTIKNLVGIGTSGLTYPGMLSSRTPITSDEKIAIAPDGVVYFAQSGFHRILRSSRPNPGAISGCQYSVPSEDRSEFFCFNAAGRHLKTLDAKTGAVIYTFTPTSGALQSIVGPTGTTTITASTNKVTIKGPFGQSTVIDLDPTTKYATGITNADSQTTAVTHDAQGLLKSMKPPENTVPYAFGYDGYGRLRSDSDPEGGAQTFDRASVGAKTTVTQTTALGRTTSYSLQIDPDSRQQRTVKSGLASDTLIPSNISDTTTPAGISQGRQTITTLMDRTKVTTVLDSDAKWGMMSPMVARKTIEIPTSSNSSLTLTKTEARCSRDDSSCPKDPSLVDSAGNYTTSGNYTSSEVINLNGNKYFKTWQAGSTNEYTLTSAAGRVTKYKLDATTGFVTSVTPPGDSTVSGASIAMTYNQGRLATISQGGGRLVTLAYNAGTTGGQSGYLSSVSDPATTTKVTSFGNILSMGDPRSSQRMSGSPLVAIGSPTVVGWDAAGRLASVTPPGKTAHGLAYSQVGLLQTYSPPVLPGVDTTTHWDYSRDRELDLMRPPGTAIDFVYDPKLERLTEVRSPEETVSLAYYDTTSCSGCAPGRVKTATTATTNHVTTFTYFGSLLAGVQQGTVKTSWTYDSNFRPTTETLLNGATSNDVTYDYDADGVTKCAAYATTCGGATAFTITPWTNSSRPKTLKLNNVSETRTFNAYGELSSQVATKSGAALFSLNYEPGSTPRDAFGRVTNRQETVNGVTKNLAYTYDDFGRLSEVKEGATMVGHYEYDDNGNRADGTYWRNASGQMVQGAFVYDAQDRLTSFSSANGATPSASFEYTPAGALKRKYGSSFEYTFSYDSLGGLRSALTPTGQIDYTLDALGRRVARSKNLAVDRKWIYARGISPIAEINAAGKLTRFVYASNPHVPDFMVTWDGTLYRILTDQLGSVRLVVNASTGAIAQELDYDAFGNVLKDTSPQFQPFGFAGGLYDIDTGLIRFGARDYDPTIGRWVSKDPRRFRGGVNLYVYSWNDPVNFFDRTGHQPTGAGGAPGTGDGGGEGTNSTGVAPNPVPGMPFDLPFGPTREEHANRNQNNRCPSHPPTVCGGDTEDDFSFDETPIFGGKYRGAAGNECAYDRDGNLLPDPSQTFNFGPDPFTAAHGWNDFAAHYWYGGEDGYNGQQTTSY